MTIEEKARAYDEALGRCKEWASGTWGHSVDDSPKEIAEFIFPQLAESEDEKLRKALIDFFDSALGKDLLQRKCGLNPDAILAYLEKQKEASKAIEAVERIDKYIDEHLANAHDMKDSNPDKKYYQGWDDALGKMAGILQDVYSGEKQKESLREFIDNFPYSAEQEEQDWNKKPCLTCQEYEKGHKQGYTEGCTAGYNKAMKERTEEILGLDGNPICYEQKPAEINLKVLLTADCLASAEMTGRLKERSEILENPEKYGLQKSAEIDEYKIIKKHITEDSLSSEVNKRLKECGWYVTDAESSEWSEEDEKDIAHIIRVLDDCYAYGKHDLSKTDHENLVGTLKSIHPQLKSKWNEEDEGELQNAIDALEFLGKKGVYESESGYDTALKAASWLKSLPERFALQPKPEWSEKDEKMLSRCVKSIKSSKQFASSSVYEKDKEINWLKALSLSFKKRNEDVAKLCSNEWSEEDEKMFEDFMHKLEICDLLTNKEIAWAKHRLKSLRPQPKQEWSEDWREEDIQTRFAFYTYKDDSSVLYLSNVFVEEASRNHGFGTRILRAAEKVAETIGAITICLKVKQDSPANAWYRKNGYGYVAFEDGYDWLEKNLEYLKPAKSTEWSEEEKDKLNRIERLIVNANAHGNGLIGDKEAIELQHFIRSIVKPTTNLVEWSEEDRLHYANVLEALEYVKGCKSDYDKIEAVKSDIAWLKLLRNRVGKEFLQPHWKPSEEQPDVFGTVAFQKGVQEGRRLEREEMPKWRNYGPNIIKDPFVTDLGSLVVGEKCIRIYELYNLPGFKND